MKKCIYLLASIFYITSAHAEEAVPTSGSCAGDTDSTCAWSFDASTGTLSITGSGKMQNWGYYDGAPWKSYVSDIYHVDISNNITTIGSAFLTEAVNLTSIKLPNNLTEIGSWAFLATGLQKIDIPQSVTDIGTYALSSSGIKEIELPPNLEFLGGSFCQICSLETLIIPESINTMHLLDTFTPFTGLYSLKNIYCAESDKDLCQEAITLNGKSLNLLSTYTSQGNRYVLDGKMYKSLSDMQNNNPVKRIYTVEEASKASGKKNSVRIRYH